MLILSNGNHLHGVEILQKKILGSSINQKWSALSRITKDKRLNLNVGLYITLCKKISLVSLMLPMPLIGFFTKFGRIICEPDIGISII